MNNIFQKNIEALRTKNPNLAERIANAVVTEIPTLVRENNAYNLIYKGTYLHNKQNPLGEAFEIFSMVKNEPVSIHVIYGMGLGYLFQTASQKSAGTVILYEPDLNILKTAFSLVDFSADILKQNVFIADNTENLCEYIHQKSNTQNSPFMLITDAYRTLAGEGLNDFVEEMQRIIGQFGLDLRYTKERLYPLILKLIKNIPYIKKETPLLRVKDFYKGKTALVVSAGPTLDRDIEVIKKYRDKLVIIVVGTAMKTLAKNGITPDFLCIIEANDCSKQISDLDLTKVNFVTEPYSNLNTRNKEYRHIYSHISSNMPVNLFWKDYTGEDISEYFSKGTVSYTALNVARLLGCAKIVLSGQDLAYVEGQCYSKESAYKDLICTYNETEKKWEITAKDYENFRDSLSNSDDVEVRKAVADKRLRDLNSSLYYVKGIKGEPVPTESVYAAFIKPLTEFTQMFDGCEYINTSLLGAQIDGFKNMPLEEALKDSPAVENRNVPTEGGYHIPIDAVQKAILSIDTARAKIEEGMRLYKNLNNDIKRYRNAGSEVLKSLKKLSAHYAVMSSEFSENNVLFDIAVSAERIELDYEMKMTREINFENIKKISEKIGNYYIKAEAKTAEIKTLLKDSAEN